MNLVPSFLARVYSLLLAFYPHDFRMEFSEEMDHAFRAAAAETRKKGKIKLLNFFAREFRDLPGAILQEHLHSSRGLSMNETNFKRPDWFFYPLWAGVSISAFAIAVLAYFPFIGLVTSWVGHTIQVNGQTHITEDYLFRFFFVPVLFLLSGVLQYALLQRYLPRMGGWILATMGGCILVFGFMALMAGVYDLVSFPFLINALTFAVIGGLIGFSQWLFLRRRIPKAGWWILASFLGWCLAALGAFTDMRFDSVLAQLTAVSVPPAIVGAITWWFLLHPKAHQQNAVSG